MLTLGDKLPIMLYAALLVTIFFAYALWRVGKELERERGEDE